ncbi:hypothetical protein FQN55_005847 [Onygenales sp. PD_40]|nr:hypothetical protein FQN55_005847 [Onygenales sp. PD_40]
MGTGSHSVLTPNAVLLPACRPIWDSDNAHISPCAEPYLAAIPAIVVALIAVYYLADHFFPRWQPKWLGRFVVEHVSHQVSGRPTGKRDMLLCWRTGLLCPAILGFVADLVRLVDRPAVADAIQLFSCAISIIVVLFKRPRTCSPLLLAYFTTVFIVKLSFVPVHADESTRHPLRTTAGYVSLTAAGVACFVIVLMPFRVPSAICPDVSAVGQQPSDQFRSPEDNLRLWQFLTVSWMAPLISTGKERKLNEPDVWSLPFEFQHRRLYEGFRQLGGSVLRRLLQANGIDIFILSSIAILKMICDFSTPILLQRLLQATKDPAIPKRIPLTYALLTLAMRLIAAQSQVLNIWYGRRCYERSRGELIMMVYEKALSRKNVFGQKLDTETSESANQTDNLPYENTDGEPNGSSTKKKESKFFFFRFPWRWGSPSKKDVKTKEAASMGKILNLIRGDVYEVSQRFWEIDSLIDKPLGLVIAVALVWNLFGPSCFLGIVTVLVAQVLNIFITRILFRWERTRRTATDTRLKITSQFVEAIRHLRWYGWHNHWLEEVMKARQDELRLRIITNVWSIMIWVVSSLASGLFPVVALYSYTVLAGHTLTIDIIFPALQLFTMLETRLRDIPNLITVLINASVAMGRIEGFMSEPDKEKTEAGVLPPGDSPAPIQLESCSYAWPGTLTPVLSDVSVMIPSGLTVISGKVGAGKTALLQALLGELDILNGSCHVPNEMIGYCAQTPWLQSMSIRDNILFSSQYDERRYKQVLDACALVQDLTNFKHGDLTFIGENGVGLSGGQKARVALARAIYSSARILLLDDPLSALDFNTAESVFRKCLCGPLARDRSIVLVTHRMTLVRNFADRIIQIDNGRAAVHDKEDISSVSEESGESGEMTPSSTQDDEADANNAKKFIEEQDSAAVPDKFIEEEHRAEGGVKSRVYWSYIKAGQLRWWAGLVVVLTIYRLTAVALSWFLKDWGEAYEESPAVLLSFAADKHDFIGDWVETRMLPKNPIERLPPPAENVGPWLWVFLALTTFQTATVFIASLVMLVIVYCAGKTMFAQAMVRVSHATFRYFDVTPVGRLMNRLTSDIGVVDGNISHQIQYMSFLAITWVTSLVVIASVTPTFLAFSLALTAAFIFIFHQFLPCSQSLRRLEMVSLSPLLSNFGELLHGLTTVRAFHAETRFQNRVIEVVDKFQGMDHFYWSLQTWLLYRFESVSAFATFCLTALALYTGVTAGLIAFVLIAAENFVTSTHGLCKQYGQLQMDFVSVERVDEICHVEQEPPGTIDPPAAWPRFGSDIVFEDVTVRYAPHLDPSLSNISLRIPGGSSTAVIGRTGSGKSTLALSLLNAVRPDSGNITIDNIDLASVNVQALRHRVTFVAQEPVLFPGSIRLNLDPVGEYSDTECEDVLHRICNRYGWTLATTVEAGGRNLSHGQRQLIGLSRAVLRRSPVVILDEATASIDLETSMEIQRIVREELRESTVVTVAHRLEAIRDAEYFVVLDQGRVVEQGYVTPRE